MLSGLTESRSLPQLELLLDLVVVALPQEGVLAIHSIAPSWWASDEGPPMADRVAGRPLRPATWEQLLAERGFETTVSRGPDAAAGSPFGGVRLTGRAATTSSLAGGAGSPDPAVSFVNGDDARNLAASWYRAWNAHDLDAVMAHWAPDAVFTSPYVAQLMGEPSGTVSGHDELRRYSAIGLEAESRPAFRAAEPPDRSRGASS